jgi:hypothetical protein
MKPIDPNTDFAPLRPECAAAQHALQLLLDGVAVWDSPEASDHRAVCGDCRDDYALARELHATPHSLSSAVVVPAELGPRIFHATVVDRRHRRLVRRVGAGAAALAASLALAVLVVPPPNQQVRSVPAPAAEGVALQPIKPLGAAVEEARDAVLALTKRTASETRDSSVRLLPKLPDPPEPMTINLDEPLADAQASAAKSVQPLATSAKRAMQLFLKTNSAPQPKVN